MFPPERIVCLTEETVETLYLLGEERRIVGISGYVVRPPRARREKPRVSAFTSANVPKILDLKPDLVPIMDVVVWLRSLGLGKYEAIFRENDIDETVLPSLTHENLKELGVASFGHRVMDDKECCHVYPTTGITGGGLPFANALGALYRSRKGSDCFPLEEARRPARCCGADGGGSIPNVTLEPQARPEHLDGVEIKLGVKRALNVGGLAKAMLLPREQKISTTTPSPVLRFTSRFRPRRSADIKRTPPKIPKPGRSPPDPRIDNHRIAGRADGWSRRRRRSDGAAAALSG